MLGHNEGVDGGYEGGVESRDVLNVYSIPFHVRQVRLSSTLDPRNPARHKKYQFFFTLAPSQQPSQASPPSPAVPLPLAEVPAAPPGRRDQHPASRRL